MSIKYVFCISPGRCGTDYLAALLGCAHRTVSFHECLPIMNGEPMRQFNDGNPTPLKQLMRRKWRAVENKRRGRIYCETNHSFIKGWGWLLPNQYVSQEEIGVILLRRDPEQNALSLLRLRDVPGITEFTRTWYLDPRSRQNLVAPPSNASFFDLCLWYISETYRLADKYKETFPNVRFAECDLSALNDASFVSRLFGEFELRPTPRLSAVVGNRFNTKEMWPRWSKEQLLEASQLPNPDLLPGHERDQLLKNMVAWLQANQAQAIAQLRPDPQLLGSIAQEISGIVAHSQQDLEVNFGVRLRFTETERLLIGELLYCIKPHDFAFLAVTRDLAPHITHHYDFNFDLTLGHVFKRIGVLGVLNGIGSMARGHWWRDPSHSVPTRKDRRS